MDRKVDGQKDRWTERQMDRKTDGHSFAQFHIEQGIFFKKGNFIKIFVPLA
jgi:hypothetical protein